MSRAAPLAAEGAFNARISAIRDIMKSFNVSFDQAMTALKIPESDWQEYREVLQQ